MKRFLLCCLLVLCGALWLPSGAYAAERLIAVVLVNSQPRYQEIHSVFAEKLKTYCGRNCRIYVQTPNADIMSLRNSIRKAVALGADLIVTYGPMATLAAQAEVPPMPTLFADVYDPVGLKLVSEPTLTGRNMSGVRGDAPIQGLLKLFAETVELDKLEVLYDINSPEARLQKQILEESGKRRGIEVVSVGVDDSGLQTVWRKALPEGVDAVFAAISEDRGGWLAELLDHTNTQRIPVIAQHPDAAEMGAFMSLESSPREQGEKLADMARQLLSGTSVSQLPMQTPHQISLDINLRVARELGIQVPIQTLSMASHIIR